MFPKSTFLSASNVKKFFAFSQSISSLKIISPFPLTEPLSLFVTILIEPFFKPSDNFAPVNPPSFPIIKSFGSSSHSPTLPSRFLATVETQASSPTVNLAPDVSTKPPLPLFLPPRAVILPLNTVFSSLHTTTLPPSPRSLASAVIEAFFFTVVVLALRSVPFPLALPPT